MTSREPRNHLRRTLTRGHGALNRAWMLRFGAPATALVALAVALAVGIGVAGALGETASWV